MESWLLGTVLGDGSLSLSKDGQRARLRFNHSSKQSGLVQEKYLKLKDFVLTSPKLSLNGGWGAENMSFATTLQKWLVPYYHASYSVEGRRIPLQLIAQLDLLELLAWWVMDDGTCTAGCLALALNRYQEQDVRGLSNLFVQRGYGNYVRASRGWYITFSREASRLLKQELMPYFIPSMQYKLEGVHSEGKIYQCKVCGADIHCPVGAKRVHYCKKEICQKVKKYMSYPPAYVVPLEQAKEKALAWGQKHGFFL